ncbi:hypothetical protein BG004_001996 [Podila humilis]|nr:hypothetical protein BG004_001996 [Podila humilis]
MTLVISQASWMLCLFLALAFLSPCTVDAHMAMLYPPPRGGVGTKDFRWTIHQFVGFEDFKYPCGGFKKLGPNTDLEAGKTIAVRFWSSAMSDKKDPGTLPSKGIEQARHGGGMCEFSLSYDGGKSFHVIATYTKTCPDAAFEWPVKIPENIRSCDDPGACADVTIKGKKDGVIPKKTIQIYDFEGHKKDVTFDGDGNSHKHGPGPIKSERDANLD